jgi:hypothetical protein
MRKLIALFVCLLFATSLMVAAGCAKKEEPVKPAAEAVKPAEPEKKAEETKTTTTTTTTTEAAKPGEAPKAAEKK